MIDWFKPPSQADLARGQEWLDFAADGFVVTPAWQAKIDADRRHVTRFRA